MIYIHIVSESDVLTFWQSKESCAHTVNDWERRPHSVSITDFGAVGDGKTLNTHAFENAFFYLRSYADKGGAQLYIPAGRWLTGSITLISHLTLFLENGAIILGSEVIGLSTKLYASVYSEKIPILLRCIRLNVCIKETKLTYQYMCRT